jgi:hypothetical protein
MRRRLPSPGLAQGFRDGQIPKYLDLLVAEGPRDQSEAEFVGALRHGLNEALGSQGIHCAAIADSIGNTGYRILLRDREGRDVWSYLSFDAILALGEQHGPKGIFDRCLGLAIEAAKKDLAEARGEPENLVEAAVREHARAPETIAKTFGTEWKDKSDGNA